MHLEHQNLINFNLESVINLKSNNYARSGPLNETRMHQLICKQALLNAVAGL